MSDMHVIGGTQDGRYRIVMHIDVPDETNAVAVNLRIALVRAGLATPTVLVDGDGNGGTIDATEKGLLANGSKVEHVESFLVESAGTTTGQIRAALRARYAQIDAQVVDELRRKLKYFGRNEARS